MFFFSFYVCIITTFNKNFLGSCIIFVYWQRILHYIEYMLLDLFFLNISFLISLFSGFSSLSIICWSKISAAASWSEGNKGFVISSTSCSWYSPFCDSLKGKKLFDKYSWIKMGNIKAYWYRWSQWPNNNEKFYQINAGDRLCHT